jgi:hypothetical protein
MMKMNQNKFSQKRDAGVKPPKTRFPILEEGQLARIRQLAPPRPNALRSTDQERISYFAQMELLGKVLTVLENEV